MDPLEAIHAALYEEDWVYISEVYWLGSLCGGLAAGLLWRAHEAYTKAKWE